MKYFLFAGNDYYPTGGINDLIGKYNSYREALEIPISNCKEFDWWHVTDENMNMIDSFHFPTERGHVIYNKVYSSKHGKISIEEYRKLGF